MASWATKSHNVKDSLNNLKETAKKDDEFLRMSPGNRKLLEYMELMMQKIKSKTDLNYNYCQQLVESERIRFFRKSITLAIAM